VSITTILRLLLVGSTLVVCASRRVVAQTVDAAHGPLFGDDLLNNTARRSLDLTTAVTAGLDTDLFADSGVGSPLQTPVSGSYQDLDGALSFVETGRRVHVTADAAGTARHMPGFSQLAASNASGGANLSVELNRRTFLRANVAGSYVSNFAFDTLVQPAPVTTSPGDAVLASASVANTLLDWTRTTYGASVTLDRAVGRASSFGVTVGAGMTERPTLEARSSRGGVTAQFSRNLGRDSLIRVLYTFTKGFETIPDSRNALWSEEAQLSVERTWHHSKFRRTFVSVSGGPSLQRQNLTTSVAILVDPSDDSDAPVEPIFTQQQVSYGLSQFVGTATVIHDITSTVSAQAWYRRGSGVSDAVLYSNAWGIDVHGWFSRRVGATLAAGYTDGDLNLGSLLNRNTTLFGSTKLQIALGSRAAVQAQYFYYRYEYKSAFELLPEGLLPQVNRRGLRVGIMLWAPLNRGRS